MWPQPRQQGWGTGPGPASSAVPKGRAKEDPIMNECCQEVARDVKRREKHTVFVGVQSPRVGGDWVQMGRALRSSEDVYVLTAG